MLTLTCSPYAKPSLQPPYAKPDLQPPYAKPSLQPPYAKPDLQPAEEAAREARLRRRARRDRGRQLAAVPHLRYRGDVGEI